MLQLPSPTRVWRGVARRAQRLLGGGSEPSGLENSAHAARRQLAERFIGGAGLEIGALHEPLWVPTGTKVTYVDRMSVADLRRHYPELKRLPLVQIDRIDDGEQLTTVSDASQDFIISNHFIEHAQDPIGTLARHLAVLKPGGILYLAVPDKHLTFDRHRPETPFAHLLQDWREGPAGSYEAHVREYASLVDGLGGAALEERIALLRRTNYSIHFHVWAQDSLRDFLRRLDEELAFPLRLETMVANPGYLENICVIRKA